MPDFKSYFYNGAYTADELDWPEDKELEDVLATWGYETNPCLTFGEEPSFGVKVYPSTGDWFERSSYLVQLDLGEATELVEVDSLPNLLKLLEQVVPLARVSLAQTSTSVPQASTSVPQASTSVPQASTSVPQTSERPAAKTTKPSLRTTKS